MQEKYLPIFSRFAMAKLINLHSNYKKEKKASGCCEQFYCREFPAVKLLTAPTGFFYSGSYHCKLQFACENKNANKEKTIKVVPH